MASFRLGVVPYLNAMPLWVPLERGLVTTPLHFTIHKAVPDRLARDLLAGSIDVALLSIVEALKSKRARVIDGVCIASQGAVETVQLFHRKPLDQCATICLDRDSRTASALTQILLRERYPREDRTYESGRVAVESLTAAVAAGESKPVTGRIGLGAAADLNTVDAFLSIGDKTWDFLDRGFEHTDLGALWTETTGLPMVWAAWIPAEAMQNREVPEVLARAREVGRSVMDEIIQRAGRNSNRERSELARYLTKVIHYKLGHDERRAITTLMELGGKHRILPGVFRLNFIT